MAESEEHHPVFVPISLLPHHEDHPIMRHRNHESHTERHRNTSDYVAEHHSPVTNRRNAGILLRRFSDDFNARKFPDLAERAKKKRRAHSEGEVGALSQTSRSARLLLRLKRLSQTALGPSTPTPGTKYPVLPESESEEAD